MLGATLESGFSTTDSTNAHHPASTNTDTSAALLKLGRRTVYTSGSQGRPHVRASSQRVLRDRGQLWHQRWLLSYRELCSEREPELLDSALGGVSVYKQVAKGQRDSCSSIMLAITTEKILNTPLHHESTLLMIRSDQLAQLSLHTYRALGNEYRRAEPLLLRNSRSYPRSRP